MPKYIFKNRIGLQSETFKVEKCRYHCRPPRDYVIQLERYIWDAVNSEEPIHSLIQLYNEKIRENAIICLNNKWSIADCVSGCHNRCYTADRSSHTHPHQNRLLKITKALLPEIIAKKEYDTNISDFEQLYKWVEESVADFKKEDPFSNSKRAYYPRQVTIYDIALRLGYHNGGRMIMPERMVYLHRGALWGAHALKDYTARNHAGHLVTDNPLDTDCRIPITSFSPELQGLGARDLEDFLCVFHHVLKALAGEDKPTIAPIVIC